MLIVLGIVFASFSYEETAGGQEKCDHHSRDWHRHKGDGHTFAQWKITAWTPNVIVEPITRISYEENWVKHFEGIFTNKDCDANTESVSTERKVTHSVAVNFGGEVSADFEWAAGMLFSKCKTTVRAKVTANKNWTDSTTETLTIKSEKKLSGCKKVKYTFEKMNRQAVFQMTVARASFICRDYSNGDVEHFHCDKRIMKSTGTGHDEVKSEWAYLGKVCDCSDPEPESGSVPRPESDQSIR